jgi:UPF0755 protein
MSFQRRNVEHTQKKRNPIMRIIILFIWIIVIIFITKYIWYSNFKSASLVEKDINISVKSWEKYSDIWKKLDLNETYFKIYKKYNSVDELKVWNYKIPENANIQEILEALQKPIFQTENITLLEGWNIFDIDEYLAWKNLINKWEYIQYAENIEKITALTKFFPFLEWITTLEWYLYPDTYTIDPAQFAINKFVIFQLETFESKVYNKLFKNTNITLENLQSVINLASIVEKEEKNSNYKKTVAGILKKRLQQGWMIWADITVCYPYRLTGNECKLVVSKYIKDKNEYNTRTMRGLPKTPIWNPSYETIEATLNHKETNYFFYLHDKKGRIFYAETNAQHEYNKYHYMK